jgi:hypothetical protein
MVVVVGPGGSVVVGPAVVVVWRVVGGRVVAPPAAGRVVVVAWMPLVVEADTPLNSPSAGTTPGRAVDVGARRTVVGESVRSSG